MEALGKIVVVEPDPAAAATILRECSRLRFAKVVDSASHAKLLLKTIPKLTALITEQQLADGAGVSVLKAYRLAYPLMPLLMLTAVTTPRVINRAHSLRAEFVAKPARRHNLRAFLRRAVAFERVPDARVALIVDDLVRHRGLSPRETDILAAAIDGVPRKTIADQIGTTENTIKSCVKGLLRKCDASSLEVLVRSILRLALAGSDARWDEEIERESVPPIKPFTIPPPSPFDA